MNKLITLYEGRVDAIDHEKNEMTAQLIDITDKDHSYAATFSLDKILPEENHLAKLGAIFHVMEEDEIGGAKLLLKFQQHKTWPKEEIEKIFNEADRMLNVVPRK